MEPKMKYCTNCKPNVRILMRGEDSKVYIWHLPQLKSIKTKDARQYQLSNKVVKSKYDKDTAIGLKYCFN